MLVTLSLQLSIFDREFPGKSLWPQNLEVNLRCHATLLSLSAHQSQWNKRTVNPICMDFEWKKKRQRTGEFKCMSEGCGYFDMHDALWCYLMLLSCNKVATSVNAICVERVCSSDRVLLIIHWWDPFSRSLLSLLIQLKDCELSESRRRGETCESRYQFSLVPDLNSRSIIIHTHRVPGKTDSWNTFDATHRQPASFRQDVKRGKRKKRKRGKRKASGQREEEEEGAASWGLVSLLPLVQSENEVCLWLGPWSSFPPKGRREREKSAPAVPTDSHAEHISLAPDCSRSRLPKLINWCFQAMCRCSSMCVSVCVSVNIS